MGYVLKTSKIILQKEKENTQGHRLERNVKAEENTEVFIIWWVPRTASKCWMAKGKCGMVSPSKSPEETNTLVLDIEPLEHEKLNF